MNQKSLMCLNEVLTHPTAANRFNPIREISIRKHAPKTKQKQKQMDK